MALKSFVYKNCIDIPELLFNEDDVISESEKVRSFLSEKYPNIKDYHYENKKVYFGLESRYNGIFFVESDDDCLIKVFNISKEEDIESMIDNYIKEILVEKQKCVVFTNDSKGKTIHVGCKSTYQCGDALDIVKWRKFKDILNNEYRRVFKKINNFYVVLK